MSHSTFTVQMHDFLKFVNILAIFLGVKPAKCKAKLQLFQFAYFMSCNGIVILLTVVFIINKGDSLTVIDMVTISPNFTMLFHGLAKQTTLFVKARTIFIMCEEKTLTFWNLDDTEEIKDILASAKRRRNIFSTSIFLFLLSSLIKPQLTGGLTLRCYTPEWLPRNVLLIIQDSACIGAMTSLCCFDNLIMTLLTHLQVQFVMLNSKIQSIFDRNNGNTYRIRNSIIECVDHYNFLMGYISDFKNAFSMIMLLYSINLILSMCVCMYVIICGYFKPVVQVDALLHLLAGLNQLYMCYAYPAQELMHEASKIKGSAYFSKWTEHPEYSKFVMMIMIRGQKEVMISAGGMVRIDLEMFLMASKTMVSCCMCLQALNASAALTSTTT